ncbi:MAG: AbrB/MazE/SpoVT family DNA-binding domain-containing protein [Candidatus Firestonebacteria bacterium]|nr:AbrB/MazE/SpoVT family DNA-binding domain-containing protein [Candidatus Firestonebacteria bacterium]
MQALKVLPKGQITLPKKIRKDLNIKEGDTLIVEKIDHELIIKKGKTIFDYIGTLPDLGISIDEIREKAIEKAVKEDE